MANIEGNSQNPVEYELDGDIAYIRLDRPDNLNAVTPSLYEGLEQGLSNSLDDDARVVVLEGNGRAFCVGADMKNHDKEDRTQKERREYVWRAQEAAKSIQTHPKPVIAKVQGYAIGAGAELALSADFILISEEAEMRFPELSIGTYIGGGVTYTLSGRVGQARAKELILTSASLTGTEAASEGIVTSAHPEEELKEAVDRLATDIAKEAPIPVEFAKSQFGRVAQRTRDDILTAEAEALLACMATEDWREGIDAFAEDREPIFKGK